ncbi:mitochondrial genome maintenance protein MGM101 [Rhypophila sp. PSN 637]
MRSLALQACCRPLRLGPSRLQYLVRHSSTEAAASPSSSTTTPAPKQAPKPAPKPTFAPKPKTAAAPRSTPQQTNGKARKWVSPSSENRIQIELFPGSTVDQVDVESAKQIPTPVTNPSAFVAALTASSPSYSANGSSSAASPVDENGNPIDWSNSFHGLSTSPFSPEAAAILMAPIDSADIEIKPDGIVYLPEIKYRRILNKAFGPGGWGLAPRGELVVGEKVVTREYALVVNGRFVAQARGECQYFSVDTIPTAGEGCKSNALMRCCKDIGIASELWDPRFLRSFKKACGHEVWVEHVVTKKRRQIWKRKDCDPAYPFQLPAK